MADAAALKALGWEVLTVWECQTKDRAILETRLRSFLGPLSRA
jgi:DNA mismatch endonuclease (patch repair protein)